MYLPYVLLIMRGCIASKTDHFLGYFQRLSRIKAIESSGFMERAMGIEPTSEAWEARNRKMKTPELAALSRFAMPLNWKMKPWSDTHASTRSSFALMPRNLVPI